jgi:PhoH-like ATPase
VIAKDVPDNRIIAVAHELQERGERAVFVSKDLSARIKSDALGIKTEDFENQKVDADRLYTGYTELTVPRAVIDELYADRMLPIETLVSSQQVTLAFDDHHEPTPNEFVVLHDVEDPAHSGLGRRLADTDHLIPGHGAAQAHVRHHGSQRAADHGVRPACSTTRSSSSRCSAPRAPARPCSRSPRA